MRIELTDEIRPVDLENARRIAELLRSLLGKCAGDPGPFVLEAGGAHVPLQPDRLASLVKLIEGMAIASAHTGQDEDAIPPEDAAQLLGVAVPSVMRLIERGELPARATDGGQLLSRAEVLAYKARQAVIRREALSELVRFTEEHGI